MIILDSIVFIFIFMHKIICCYMSFHLKVVLKKKSATKFGLQMNEIMKVF